MGRGLVFGALLVVSGGLMACVVGHAYQRPACQQIYDECTDQCAPMCEKTQTSALDPEEATYDAPQSVCADCVQRCKERADECEKKP